VRQKKILYPSNILIVKPIMIEDIIAQKKHFNLLENEEKTKLNTNVLGSIVELIYITVSFVSTVYFKYTQPQLTA
jgi:hypothetical protein